jgi:hypothetical protein
MPRYSKWSLSFRFPHQKPVLVPLLPHFCHMHHPANSLSPSVTICKMQISCSKELLALHINPKMEHHPLSALSTHLQ